MKKTLGSYYAHYFKMPYLFRSDLETIEQIILEQLHPKKYRIACGGFEYDSVNDIPQDAPTVHTLVVYTHSPCLRLKFAHSWAELYCGDSAGSVNAVHRIADVVIQSEQTALWSLCKYSAWLAPLIGFGSTAIAFGSIHLGLADVGSLYVAGFVFLCSVLWWVIGYRFNLYRFSCIDFQKERGEAAFLERYQAIIVPFIVGLLFGGLAVSCILRIFR